MKEGQDDHLLDLIAYMNTEGWSVQMRSFARGSDGLAEISIDDAKNVIIPLIDSDTVRAELTPFIENLKKGKVTLKSIIQSNVTDGKWDIKEPSRRPSHIVLV